MAVPVFDNGIFDSAIFDASAPEAPSVAAASPQANGFRRRTARSERRRRLVAVRARDTVLWNTNFFPDPEVLDVPAFSLSAQPAAVKRPRKTQRVMAALGSTVFGIQRADADFARAEAYNSPDTVIRQKHHRPNRRHMAALLGHVFGAPLPFHIQPDTTPTPANRNQTVYVVAKQPHVHLHSAFWPYQRLATLKTAYETHRGDHWMNYGPGSFVIARNDIALDNSPSALQRGAWIVIESNKARPWVGFIRTLSENLGDSTIKADCVQLAGLLDVKAMRQTAQLVGASGGVFAQVMRDTNARGHTGLFAANKVEPGPRVDINLAGQTAFRALNELADRTGYEWWVEAEVSAAAIKAQVNWGFRQGFDNAKTVKLYEGEHFADLQYTLDTSGARQSVTLYGGVGELSERTTVTRAANYSPRGGVLGTGFEPAGDLYNRALDVPPSLRSEDVYFRVMTADRTELSMETQRSMERGIAISERGTAVCNNTFDWRLVGVGDFIQLVTHNTGLGAVNRKVRVTGIQPDEAAGEMVLSWETPLK